MMLRFTFLFLTGLATTMLPFEVVRAAMGEDIAAHHDTPQMMAQAPEPAPAFLVDPAAVNNTNQSVPNLANPQTNPSSRAIGAGNQGDSVKVLQQQLQQRGYYDGPVDGIYGQATQQAVQSFQRDAGFDQTGQVEPATRQRLATPTVAGNAGQLPATPTATAAAPTGASEASSAGSPASAGESLEGTAVSQAPAGESAASEGTEPTAAGEDAAPPSDESVEAAAARVEAAVETSNGITRLLWPALALIAALGSFGIGFVLANRGKTGEAEGTDDPWGQVSPDLPLTQGAKVQDSRQSLSSSAMPNLAEQPGRHNAVGMNGQHGSGRAAIATSEVTPVQTPAPITPLSTTTKLSKVNIVDELISDLQVTDASKRRRTIWELGQRGNSTAIQPLVNAMVDADSKEKSLILAALSEIGIRSLKPMNRALAIALQDENAEVRKNAIRDLTRIYDLVAQISQMLGHATEDEDPEVRQTANWALEQLSRIRQAPDPRTMLQSADSSAKQPDLLSGDLSN